MAARPANSVSTARSMDATGFKGVCKDIGAIRMSVTWQSLRGERSMCHPCSLAASTTGGSYRAPGLLERLEGRLTTQYQGTVLVRCGSLGSARQPEIVSGLFLNFLKRNSAT